MTDDRNPLHDDLLDTRIRSLVATAVADAPPPPAIDESTVRTTPFTDDTTARPDGSRRWIAGGLAGLSVAAAIVALFLISRPDEVTAPVVPATQPTVGGTAPATVPSIDPDEQAEDTVVEADPDRPSGSAPTQVLSLRDDGVIGVDEDGSERALTTEPMATAVLLDDGRILAQRATGEVPVFEPPILSIDSATGEIDVVETPSEFDGLTAFLHDSASIDGEAVVLVTLRPESCAMGADCIGQLVAWWPDTDEVRVVARRNVFEGGWRLPTLADNGLVVGIELESASHGFFAAAVPGTDDVDVPAAAELGLEEGYFDCETCPNAFTTDATGQVVAWLETDESSGDLAIVMRSVDQSVRVPLSGFGDAGPPSAARVQLLMPFAGFDPETGEPFGSFALAPDIVGPAQEAWFGSLLDEGVLPFGDGGRVVFP